MHLLITLAEKLDAARKLANEIEATAPTADVYGDVSSALTKTLAHIVGSREEAERVHSYIIETGESVRWCLVAGYDVTARPIGNSWKVTDPEGETIGRIYLNRGGSYSPERAINRILPSQYSLDAAVFEIVQDFRFS
jgi:hypothetical protein